MASSLDVPDGDYELGLHVTDLAGNDATELVPVYLGPDVIVPAAGGCSVTSRASSRGGLAWLALVVLGAVVVRARRRAAVAAAAVAAASLAGAGCGPSSGSTSDAGRDARLFVMDTGACDDEDMDGVCDSDDACWGHPDGSDGDSDGVPDACDCDASGSMCDDDAECADGDDGVVCNCNPGFVGDGTTCLPEGVDGGMIMRPDTGVPVDAGGDPDLGAVALFVDHESDAATLLYVGTDGRVIRTGATTGDPLGRWDFAAGVVDEATDTARVLFYDTFVGGGRYVEIDLETAAATILLSEPLSAGWDAIVPVACDAPTCDRYYFHDADASLVAVLEMTQSGGVWSTSQTDVATLPGAGYDDAWRQAWDSGGGSSVVGLHRASDGFYGRVTITTSGANRGQLVRSAGNIVVDFLGGTFAGFDSVTPIPEAGYLAGAGTSDEVFNYRRDGSAQVGRMSAGSAVGLRDWPAGSFGAWTDIVHLDNGNTVFYDAAGSAGMVGRFTVGGTVEFVNLGTYATPGAGFEHVTALLSPTP
jgi:MYXO-CTERM domain-containing protein